MREKNKDNATKKIKLTNPVVSLPKSIKIFNSIEESKGDEINFIVNQSPIERLRLTVILILKVYNVTRESLREKKQINRIHIIKS